MFYEQNKLIPVGIGLSAVETLSGKMAYGLRKCVQKFKRVWSQTPEGAKMKGVASIKSRLKDLGLTPDDGSLDKADSVEDIGNSLQEAKTLEKKPSLDWAAVAAKVRAHTAAKSAQGERQAEVAKKQEEPSSSSHRPVATPARSQHVLPDFVLQAMKEDVSQPLKAFATTQGKEDAVAAVEDAEKKTQSKKKKKVAKKRRLRKRLGWLLVQKKKMA